ncbi:MAG: response regulator [Candidatus Margulisbacteria bacterium]|nr:response regulator [Candidatus Margulisiibacteriota bacterium]
MKILIVDDEKEFSEFLAFRLGQLGYEVFQAENGSKGLEVTKSEKPNVILADVQMPEMDGYEFTRIVKSTKDINSIPIIMLTSLENSESISKALTSGAEDYIGKPCDLSKLVEKLRKVGHHE